MKHYVAIFFVISILSLTGSTFGDQDIGCPTRPDEANNLNLNDIMFDRLHECFGEPFVSNFQRTENMFYITRDFCKRQNSFKNCLKTTSVNSAGCHLETEHTALDFVEDMLKTASSYGCVKNGQYYPYILFKVFSEENSTMERNLVHDCFKTAQSTVVPGNNSDMPTKMLGFYGEIKAFKHCIVHQLSGLDKTEVAWRINRAIYEAEFMLNGILRSMKCLHKETGATVFCKNMDTAESINELVCPFLGGNEGESLDAKAFYDLALRCLSKNLNQLNFDDLKTFTKLEEHKRFFHTYCQNRPLILNCVADVSSNSKVCLNQTEHQFVVIHTEFYENVIETGCKQDGRIFVTLFNGIFNDAKRAVEYTTVQTCVDAASESFNDLSVSNSDNYPSVTRQVYITLNTFKQCIMDGASNVGSFKTVFDSFANDVLRSAQCVHPDTRATVLCETIVNNV